MVLVSHRYKFIFIKTKKTAGTSVECFFEKYCVNPSVRHVQTHKIKETVSKYGIIGSRVGLNSNSKFWINHLSAEKIKLGVGDKTFNNYFKFTVVRNPYDKIVSKYFFMKSNYEKKHFGKCSPELKTFKKFVKTFIKPVHEPYEINDEGICDFYIKFENLKNDIVTVCQKLGIKDCDISELGNFKSEHRKNKQIHYSKYYDEKTKNIVSKCFDRELKRFGYTFEQI